MKYSSKWMLIPVVMVLAGLSGAQQPAENIANPDAAAARVEARKAAAETSQDYVISPNDVVEVLVNDAPDFSRDYRVSSTGELTIPLLPEPLNVAGKTLGSVARELERELKKAQLVNTPRVTISVKESRMHSIAVTGAVKSPQIYPVFGYTRLLDLLSQAGGLADNAGPVVKVTRAGIAKQLSQGKEEDLKDAIAAANDKSVAQPEGETITVRLKELLSGGNSRLNIRVYSGDWVTVPQAEIIYVVGAVTKSGGFALSTAHENMTVLQALAYAEDAKPTARMDHAMILRPDATAPEGRREIAINLKHILEGKSPDVQMKPDDILFVPDSTSKRAFRRGAEAAIQALTGLAVYRR